MERQDPEFFSRAREMNATLSDPEFVKKVRSYYSNPKYTASDMPVIKAAASAKRTSAKRTSAKRTKRLRKSRVRSVSRSRSRSMGRSRFSKRKTTRKNRY